MKKDWEEDWGHKEQPKITKPPTPPRQRSPPARHKGRSMVGVYVKGGRSLTRDGWNSASLFGVPRHALRRLLPFSYRDICWMELAVL